MVKFRLSLARLRQDLFHFATEDGDVQGYGTTTRKDGTMARMRVVGLVSHATQQSLALLRWLASDPIGHAIYVRQYDDTNVMISPSNGESDASDNSAGRQGRSRVAQLLGMIQHVYVRRVKNYEDTGYSAVECVQLHAPSQILPKASSLSCG